MELDMLCSILSQGSIFNIETNKTVNMAEGAPSAMMLKISRYTITTTIDKPSEDSWWSYTDHHPSVVQNIKNRRSYLLCALYKGAGWGSSSFFPLNFETGEFDESRAYTKRELAKFMPVQEPFKADYMTLPIDSIIELIPAKSNRPIDSPEVIAGIESLTGQKVLSF